MSRSRNRFLKHIPRWTPGGLSEDNKNILKWAVYLVIKLEQGFYLELAHESTIIKILYTNPGGWVV